MRSWFQWRRNEAESQPRLRNAPQMPENEFLSSPRVHGTPKQCRLILFWSKQPYITCHALMRTMHKLKSCGTASTSSAISLATLPSSCLFHLACLERTANMLVLRVSEHCHRVELPDTVYVTRPKLVKLYVKPKFQPCPTTTITLPSLQYDLVPIQLSSLSLAPRRETPTSLGHSLICGSTTSICDIILQPTIIFGCE